MQIGIIGVNHKSAGLGLREKLAKACERRFGLHNSVHARYCYLLLSTCNRTEVYFTSSDLAQTHIELLAILRHEIKEPFEHRIYSYFGKDCFFHLACVTAGLDSALIGETEIQGQVKRAYAEAADARFLSRELHFLFQKCLKIGKNVRSQGIVTCRLPSLEEVILQVSLNVLRSLNQPKVLFVGLSEINYKIYTRFKQKGFQNITFCNRSHSKMQSIPDIKLLEWAEIERWSSFDFIIFGTKSPHFLVTPTSLVSTPKLVIDLSVPRNVDPLIGRQKEVTLLNIDQLNRLIDRKRRAKAAEMALAGTQVIATIVNRQITFFTGKEDHRLLFTMA